MSVVAEFYYRPPITLFHFNRISRILINSRNSHAFQTYLSSQVQASAADTDAVPVPSSASLSSPGDPALPPVSWGMNFTFDVDALVAGADGNDTASAPSALLPSENALSVSLFCTAVVRLQGVICFCLIAISFVLAICDFILVFPVARPPLVAARLYRSSRDARHLYWPSVAAAALARRSAPSLGLV